MKLLYFAWLRERIGVPEEDIDLPASVTTAHELITFLGAKGDNYQAAFSDLDLIKVAIDQEHAPLEASVVGAREVAFFPPVTGG